VPSRRGSYRSLASLQRDNRRCRACAEAGFPLGSLPVFEGREGQRAYLYGQAPGALEGGERRPWRGRAGRTLRRWLDMDEARFYGTFYCASITRCYPGKHPSGRGDRAPRPAEQALCSFWFGQELRLLRPRLIVTVGGMAARSLLGPIPLDACVGERFERDGLAIVPLPHPSGASGWLNEPQNRERLEHGIAQVQAALAELAG
jgi:uracil-DNA glycosylase